MMRNSQQAGGQVSFVQHDLPPLDPGEYELTLSQNISVTGADIPDEVYAFAIQGERFQLRPAEIIKVFPPPNSHGEYALTLPHVVLLRTTLPWERTPQTPSEAVPKPSPTRSVPQDQAPKGDHADVAPWLAVLLFDQDDPPTAAQGATVGQAKRYTIRDLLHDDLPPHADQHGGLPANTLSYFPQKPWADLLEPGESPDDSCQIIDVPLSLWNRVAPSASDLPWLAHTRTVDDGQGNSTAYAVVIGNRLPVPGEKRLSTAHLVSLEGMEAYLPDDQGQQSVSVPAEIQYVRLVSLSSWQFIGEDKGSFAVLLESLNKVPAIPCPAEPVDTLLRRPCWGTVQNQMIREALSQGYAALPYHTRTGQEAISWYRGPFVPFRAALTITLPARSADDLIYCDATNGLYDTSYAAAWQIGRLLALSNRKFATRLQQWREAQAQQTVQQAIQTHGLDRRRRRAYYAQVTSLLQDAGRIGALNGDAPSLAPDLAKWLASLYRLHGVPFSYLVPDETMLPPESLRFFQVDPNWQACLIDGAMSIGRATLSAWSHDQAFARDHFVQVQQEAGQTQPALSGFLLRSAVVKGWWPGIRADGYDGAQAELSRLRLDPLSDTTLLALFDGEVQQVNIHEPSEGVHFGLRDLSTKELKYISGTYQHPDGTKPVIGQAMLVKSGGRDVPISYDKIQLRDGPQRVLAIHQLAPGLKGALVTNHGLTADDPYTAAEFALEMVEGVHLVTFALGQ